MKKIVIPQSECDYFLVIEESGPFALICVKGFEFVVMDQPKFVEDIKTGNLHEVTLEAHGETRSLHYVKHTSLADVAKEQAELEIKEDSLVYYLETLNISLN